MAANAYCSKANFENILGQLDENPTLFNTINEFYNLTIDTSDDELFELMQNNDIVLQLYKREHASVVSDPEAFEKIEQEDYSGFLNDVLILDDDKDVDKPRKDYGILAVHSKGQFFKDNNFHFGYSIEIDDECKFKCWEDVVGQKPMLPVNSAILIDNYLWSNLNEFSEENKENLYPIIKHLIPKTLKTPFHLIFVVENGKSRFNQKNAEEKLKKVLKFATNESGVEVKGAIIAQTDTKIFHERVLVTNHHYFYSDKGFAIFRQGILRNPTKGDRNFVFKDIDNYVGETRKHQQLNIIRNIKKAIKDNTGVSERSAVFNVGDLNSPLLN